MSNMRSFRSDTAWQKSEVTGAYLDGVRGAIPLAGEQIDVLVRLARAARPAAVAILDLGCGDGILGQAMLEAFAANRPTVVLADFSPPMLEAAQQRLAAKAQDHHLRFVAVDYAHRGWTALVTGSERRLPARYDIIVSGFSIHHQPDAGKRRIYGDIFGMLAPGGIFLNLEHIASASPWGERQFEAYFIDALYRYHAASGMTREQVAADFYHRPDKSANQLATVEAQCAWLREIGFVEVDCFLKVFELAIFGGLRPAVDERPLSAAARTAAS